MLTGGSFELLKSGMAQELGSKARAPLKASGDSLSKMFGKGRVAFYKALLDSVRDFKAAQLKTDKRSVAIKRLKESKGELIELVKNIREQLATLGPERIVKLTTAASEKEKRTKTLQALRLTVANNYDDDKVRRMVDQLDTSADKKGSRNVSIPQDLKKYITIDLGSRSELEERIQADILSLETEHADSSTTSSIILSITAIQAYLADAGTLLIRTRAMATTMQDVNPESELNRDDVVLTAAPMVLDTEFFVTVFGKLRNLTYKIAPLDQSMSALMLAPSTTYGTNEGAAVIKSLERYRTAVESVLRYLSGMSREADEAVRKFEKENKSPLGSAKVPSAKEVYAIYDAFEADRHKRSEMVNQIAYDLGVLVRNMEDAREYVDGAGPDAKLKERKQREFDYECQRLQRKVNDHMGDYPEMREMYLQICKSSSSPKDLPPPTRRPGEGPT